MIRFYACLRYLTVGFLFFLPVLGGISYLYGQSHTDSIRVNQIGYYPENQKTAVVIGSGLDSFEVRTADLSKTVYSGALAGTGNWAASGEDVMIADFSELRKSGDYVVVVPDMGRSYPFEVSKTVLDSASVEAARYFYYNRASMALEQQYAGDYARPMGHPDDSVQVHSSANSSESSPIKSPGGWYDAGDYGKYLMTAGISTYTLLSLHEQFPDYSTGMNLNIPESSNNIPDLLDQCLYELRWMMTMQDTADGGVYHKLTTMNFAGEVMPHEATATRYVCGKNTNVTLDFASTMAAASRIFRKYENELPGFSDSCLAAAEQAWTWAQNNPNVDAQQCPDFETGAYGDNDQSDEFIWAAAELYLATGDESYYNAEPIASGGIGAPSWLNKKALAIVSLLTNADSLEGNAASDLGTLESMLQDLADNYVMYRNNNSPYRIVMGQGNSDWVWGSNGVAGNQAFMLLTAYNYFNDRSYFNAAFSNVNYLLGENATGYSFLTGFGEQSPMDPHHRISGADNVTDPVPGMVVGGPHGGQQDNCNYPSNLNARSYLDEWCSYSTNEVTINWNAPFVFASTGLHAIMQRECKAPDLRDSISLCAEGTPVTLDAGTPDAGNYTWYKNGNVLTEDSASTYTIDSSMQILEGTYSVLRDSAGCRHRDTVEVVPGTSYDTDGDGTSDCSDGCLYDANKTSPGDCGCGTPDTDSDGDGIADCNDGCPDDADKEVPGECGCSVADVDSDGDGILDCNDGCPEDENKAQPGECGCGTADADSDNDGVLDCNDQCPDDADKTQPGTCGCGVADTDTDGDGTVDCNDGCPDDANKTSPGDCGCGTPDTDSDGDGIADCNDGCPDDADKEAPGECGCGVADVDSDGDGTLDCNDGCPEDENKTQPGECGCGTADADSDNDGVLDCNDQCPDDADKTQPGTCGCGVADTDTDGDGTVDCNDGCPNDANKTEPGECGCGIAETACGDCDPSLDSDNDGVNNCDDQCPQDANKTQPGECGCGNTEESCEDCAGVANGNAFIDSCGVCAGGTTDRAPVTNSTQCKATAVSQTDIQSATKVYPNPFSDKLTIELPEHAEGTAVLMDLKGRKILSKDVSGTAALSVEGLSEGMYLLRVQVNGEVEHYKVNKQ